MFPRQDVWVRPSKPLTFRDEKGTVTVPSASLAPTRLKQPNPKRPCGTLPTSTQLSVVELADRHSPENIGNSPHTPLHLWYAFDCKLPKDFVIHRLERPHVCRSQVFDRRTDLLLGADFLGDKEIRDWKLFHLDDEAIWRLSRQRRLILVERLAISDRVYADEDLLVSGLNGLPINFQTASITSHALRQERLLLCFLN